MSKYIIDGEWKYKATVDKNKRADYMRALSDLSISTHSMAEDLAYLEYCNDDIRKKRIIARITDIRVGLDLLEKNL